MTEPVGISVEDARRKVNAGAALLVCAYDDDEKFKNISKINTAIISGRG